MNIKKISLMFLLTLLLIINCSPKVEVLNEVPKQFVGTFYEISDEVIQGLKIPDSIVVSKKFFGHFENAIDLEPLKYDSKLFDEEFRRKQLAADSILTRMQSEISEILPDYSNTRIKEVRLKNENEINLFCEPLESAFDLVEIIQIVEFNDYFHFYHVSLVGYEEKPEFIPIGKFTRNKYFSSNN